VVCFSAGNSSYSHVGNPGDMEEVVGVTAMGPDYKKAGYSNYGSAADLFAPGGASSANPEDPKQVYSTYINGGYAYLWGTSMACPHVSGVAALIVSYYGVDTPGFTAERCREILLRSFRPVGEYVAVCAGAGQRRGESLCRVDEKSALGHDLLQRRLPARELFIGDARRLTALLY
jgi:serine protease